MFRRPLLTKVDTINVEIHEAVIDKYVFTIALVCPSSTANAELNDGFETKQIKTANKQT
jgi:hypothetical protein